VHWLNSPKARQALSTAFCKLSAHERRRLPDHLAESNNPRRMAVVLRKPTGYRVYCDESNTEGGKPHPVYGAVLVALHDIRTVQQELADWRRREEMHGELKWEKVRGGLA
jgi:hypothetical protein